LDGTVEIRDDLAQQLPFFKAIRAKHSIPSMDDTEMLEGFRRKDRVMLVITPDKPMAQWASWTR